MLLDLWPNLHRPPGGVAQPGQPRRLVRRWERTPLRGRTSIRLIAQATHANAFALGRTRTPLRATIRLTGGRAAGHAHIEVAVAARLGPPPPRSRIALAAAAVPGAGAPLEFSVTASGPGRTRPGPLLTQQQDDELFLLLVAVTEEDS